MDALAAVEKSPDKSDYKEIGGMNVPLMSLESSPISGDEHANGALNYDSGSPSIHVPGSSNVAHVGNTQLSWSLGKLMRLILKENSFKFNDKHFLQTHGVAMGTKMAVAFAVIFMAHIEKQLLAASPQKPIIWKRFQCGPRPKKKSATS